MENKMNEMYSWNQPYPKVEAGEENLMYARAMLDNLGGRNSEMSAVSLYFYDNLLASDYPEIAKAFHAISMVEIHHMDIFAKLALQLGEEPRLWSWERGYRKYWSPGYHLYPTKMGEILQYAITEEKAAIDKYIKQATKIQNENIVSNLERIIQDERVHVTVLNQLRQRYFP